MPLKAIDVGLAGQLVRISISVALALTLVAGPDFALAGQIDRQNPELLNAVVEHVNRYTRLTIFDNVDAAVNEGIVTLTGQVTLPLKRTEIETRVALVAGVKEIDNRIEVLPVSNFDDALRYRIARAIYSNPSFWAYAALPDPPIHVVVKHGRVTLTGSVDSDVDKLLAFSLASFSGAFSVTNELKAATEARAGAAAF